MELLNYIDSLKTDNRHKAAEWEQTLREKRKKLRSSNAQTAFARRLAETRRNNWHSELNLRRELQDKLAEKEKIIEGTKGIMEKYESYAQEDVVLRREMKREWASEEDRRKRGGRTMWPVWVVQLICELLVNGTAPTSIPVNIRTMYYTLYGKYPADEPSVSFCRECRVIVEVIGETIAALKLAHAPRWLQLWTDATTRRQIPFTALVIGLLGDGSDDKIDPVVVSSCIFMEDETAEMQAKGIVDKVCHV